MQITVNEKTKLLLEMLKDDNRGMSASEIFDNGVWAWAEKFSPETIKRLHSDNLENVTGDE